MKRSKIGGQGVIEGVMMRAPSVCAIAVRKESGEVVYTREDITMPGDKNKFYKWPIIRGIVAFVDMLCLGVTTMTKATKLYDETSEEYEPSKFEKFIAKKTGKDIMDVAMVFAVIVAVAIAIGMFFILPNVLANLFQHLLYGSAVLDGSKQFVINIIDGGIRLIIFIGYILAITLIKDIKRVFRYHGAEHKTINCFEHEEELTIENVQKYRTLHPRCGTSYLLIVMVISILLFSLLGWSPSWLERIGLRLLMLPVVAGVSYEFLKFAALGESLFFRIIRWPGMMLQKLTTAEPDDSMVEVAVLAFTAAMNELDKDALDDMAKRFSRPKVVKEVNEVMEESAVQSEP